MAGSYASLKLKKENTEYLIKTCLQSHRKSFDFILYCREEKDFLQTFGNYSLEIMAWDISHKFEIKKARTWTLWCLIQVIFFQGTDRRQGMLFFLWEISSLTSNFFSMWGSPPSCCCHYSCCCGSVVTSLNDRPFFSFFFFDKRKFWSQHLGQFLVVTYQVNIINI